MLIHPYFYRESFQAKTKFKKHWVTPGSRTHAEKAFSVCVFDPCAVQKVFLSA